MQDLAARVKLLRALATATCGRFGLGLLHLAVAMIRDGLATEALPLIHRGLLPRSAPAGFLSDTHAHFPGSLHQACLREIAAALIPETVSGLLASEPRCRCFKPQFAT